MISRLYSSRWVVPSLKKWGEKTLHFWNIYSNINYVNICLQCRKNKLHLMFSVWILTVTNAKSATVPSYLTSLGISIIISKTRITAPISQDCEGQRWWQNENTLLTAKLSILVIVISVSLLKVTTLEIRIALGC